MLSGLKMKQIVIRLQRIDENYPRKKAKFEPIPPIIKSEEGSEAQEEAQEEAHEEAQEAHSRSHKYREAGIVYSCQKCGKVCRSKDRLASHTRAQHKLKPAKMQPSVCAYCGKVFTSLSRLEDHMVVHTKEKHFQCNKCKVSFSWKHDLAQHSKTHTKADVQCSKCELYFPSRRQLKSHEETHHGIEKLTISHPCGECGTEFTTKETLFRHSKIHRKPRIPIVTVCPYCERQCVTNSRLMRHIFTHTKEKSFECDKCKMSFSWKKGLVKHSKTHTDQDVKCKQCELRFSSRNKLKFHEGTHLGTAKVSTAHLCGNCGLEFPSYPKLLIHSKTHRPERVPKVTTCHYCDKQFASHRRLIAHIRIHTKEKPFQCPKCKLSFSLKRSLENHSKSHTDTDFKCQKCELCFSRRNRLESHENIHHGIVKAPTKHSCGDCGSDFPTKAELVLHSSKDHPRNVDDQSRVPVIYTCQYCGKTLASKYRLDKHIRTHTPKSFCCSVCQTTFSNKAHLTRHSKIHKDCTQCNKKVSLRYIDRHLKTHEATTEYKLCGKKLSCPQMLESHYKIHKGGKDFKCDKKGCNKAYVSKFELNRHQRRAFHSEVPSFVCDICHTAYDCDEDLQVHKEVHIGTLEEHNYCSSLVSAQKETGLESERLIQNIPHPHTDPTRVHSNQAQKLKCVSCDKTFYNVNQLVRHMKLHHQFLKNKINSQTGINDTSRKSDETAVVGDHQCFVGPGGTSNTGTGSGDGVKEGSSSNNKRPKKRVILPKTELQTTTMLQAWTFQHHTVYKSSLTNLISSYYGHNRVCSLHQADNLGLDVRRRHRK